MERKDQAQGDGFPRTTTPTKAAAALLGIFIAMYLAVAALLHMVSGPDAAAATAKRGATVVSATASEPAGAIAVSQPLPAESAGEQSSIDHVDVPTEPASGPRECDMKVVMEPECIFE